MTTIKEFQNEYRWLSNFATVSIELNGITYPSVEHAFMSAKNDGAEWKRTCAGDMSAAQIKAVGRKIKLVDNWDEIKVPVMRICVMKKFAQEPFKSKLLATGTATLEEGNLWNDTFWGINLKTGAGDNRLGKIIMKVRWILQQS